MTRILLKKLRIHCDILNFYLINKKYLQIKEIIVNNFKKYFNIL